MKKDRKDLKGKLVVSKPQRIYHLLLLVFPLGLFVFIILAVYHVVRDKEGSILFFTCVAIMFVMGMIGLIGYVWKFLDDPILGRYSFDKNGITFYTPLRTITFIYEECAEIGFTRWIGGGAITNQYIYYIYFSKRTLTAEQRAYLFWRRSKTKRGKRRMPLYQSEYVLFQYRPDIFSSFVECVPEKYKQGLLFTEKKLKLKAYERFLHR